MSPALSETPKTDFVATGPNFEHRQLLVISETFVTKSIGNVFVNKYIGKIRMEPVHEISNNLAF